MKSMGMDVQEISGTATCFHLCRAQLHGTDPCQQQQYRAGEHVDRLPANVYQHLFNFALD